jgi:hypothetical protein
MQLKDKLQLLHEVNKMNVEKEFQGRECSEIYSCTEDMYYFLNLAIPFVS